MSNADFTSRPQEAEATRLAAPIAAAPVIAPGTLLGNTYLIEALLARGGMGEVYRARHAELGTEHAIKIVLPGLADDPKIVQAFREEARKLGRVNNDAVVDYEGFFRDEHGRRYLVTEFVPGESLEQVLRRRRLEPSEVLRLRDRIALGLAAAHEMGIVHRDVSPENIILPEGDVNRAKIIDFGIAKSADPSSPTVVGSDFAGKYSYVSPEQLGLFGGRVDLRADIYSLGLTLAAAAIGFGRKLDMGSSAPTMIAARQRVPDLSEVSEPLRPVIAPMLEPRPENRPPSMHALLVGPKLTARERFQNFGQRGSPPRSTRKLVQFVTGGFIGALLVVGSLVAVLWPPRPVEEIRTDLEAAVSGYQCSELSSSVTPDRTAVVSGFAGSPTDIARLRQTVEAVRGVATLSFDVKLRAWPHCEVAALLKPLVGEVGRNSAILSLASGGSTANIGTPLLLDIRSPIFDSYVYIDYYPAGDEVLHLFPNDKDLINFRPARNRFVLGQWPMRRCWTLGGEAGTQLVTLIGSARELFPSPRPEVEKVRDYLVALTQALRAGRRDRSDAALLFFDLEARDNATTGADAGGCPSG